MRVAVLFGPLGPYHVARLEAAGRLGEVWCVEGGGVNRVYPWCASPVGDGFRRVTVCATSNPAEVGLRALRGEVWDVMERIDPGAVAVPGWDDRMSLIAMQWARRRGRGLVMMSDSNAHDYRRSMACEWIKRLLVRQCAAGLAAGTLASEYLTRLGLERSRVFTGYDVVDNGHFARGASEARARAEPFRAEHGIRGAFFLASARFVEKKNLGALLRAYGEYRRLAGEVAGPGRSVSPPWGLVILGDGPCRGRLEALIAELGIGAWVTLVGFKQYAELPQFYGLASALVHASLVEQWGLVVNEAMASGLPVLVSKRCGCVPDLVEEGSNGFSFDPEDVDALARLMREVWLMPTGRLEAMGRSGQEKISGWSVDLFARSLWGAAAASANGRIESGSILGRLAVSFLLALRGVPQHWRRARGALGVGEDRRAL